MAYPTITEHHKLYPNTSVMASPYSCDNTGTLDIAASIELIKANQSNIGTIYFPHGTYKLSTNLTIPIGMSIEREAGAIISIDAGITLTIGCPITGPDTQLFSGSGSVIFQSTFRPSIRPHWFASLAAAIAAASTNTHVLILPRGAWPVTANLSVPSTCYVIAEKGADIQIANTKTITFAGNNFSAGRYQVFTLTGTGAVAELYKTFPEWFSAVGDEATDCTNAIKAAIAAVHSLGGVVEFDVGVYLVTPDEITITNDGVTLQGVIQNSDRSGTGLVGTTIKSSAGTGNVIGFVGAGAWTALPVMDCRMNDFTIDGDEETVTGLSLKWVSSFRQRNVLVKNCYSHGVHMEQVWDSSFYDLETELCGNQAASKAALHIYNGTTDNSNNLRFYNYHAEHNYGNDVWIDATGAGFDNYNFLFNGGKCEKDQTLVSPTIKGFYLTGWDGANGQSNIDVTIRDMVFSNYYTAGDIGVHFVGAGFVTVDNCFFTNTADTGTAGIQLEGPVLGRSFTHKITNNHFQYVPNEIVVASTCPRGMVFTEGNTAGIYTDVDSRIHINSDLVRDRRRILLAAEADVASTSGTGEDVLVTTVLPAYLLETHGGVHIRAAGWVTGVAGNKTIKLKFGTSVASVFPAGALTGAWRLEATIRQHTDLGNQILEWFFINAATNAVTMNSVALNEGVNVDVDIVLTGECANGGDTIYLASWYAKEI